MRGSKEDDLRVGNPAAPFSDVASLNGRPSFLRRVAWLAGLAARDVVLAINPAFAEGLIATVRVRGPG